MLLRYDGIISEEELKEQSGLTIYELKQLWSHGLKFYKFGGGNRPSRYYLIRDIIGVFEKMIHEEDAVDRMNKETKEQ